MKATFRFPSPPAHLTLQVLPQGAALIYVYVCFVFLITTADGISRTESTTPTLLTMPGGDEEEARVEEGVKNVEEKHVRDFGDKPEVIIAEKAFFRGI